MAQREIGLSAGEPPATRGYPPSTFSLLAGLLERAGTDTRGSITGIYTVLVDGDDHNEPIADTVRSILDGHVVLDRALALSGHHPAIDVLGSVSRVAGKVTAPERRAHAATLRAVLAARRRANDLIDIGAYQPERTHASTRRSPTRGRSAPFSPSPSTRRARSAIVAPTRRSRRLLRRSVMTRSFSLAGLLRVREIQERAAAQRLSRAVIDAQHTEARDRSLRAHLSGVGSEAVDVRSLCQPSPQPEWQAEPLLADLRTLSELQEQTVDLARTEHAEARRAMRGLDRLSQAHALQVRTAELRAEQAELDEIGARIRAEGQA